MKERLRQKKMKQNYQFSLWKIYYKIFFNGKLILSSFKYYVNLKKAKLFFMILPCVLIRLGDLLFLSKPNME